MLLKIIWDDGDVCYYEAIQIETHRLQDELEVHFSADYSETYDLKAGEFYIQLGNTWERVLIHE